jgi:hypothetical protein
MMMNKIREEYLTENPIHHCEVRKKEKAADHPSHLISSHVCPSTKNEQVEVASVTTYETSAVGTMLVYHPLLALHCTRHDDSNDNNHIQHVFLHFGVNGKQGQFFQFENVAWNGSSSSTSLLDVACWQSSMIAMHSPGEEMTD